MAFLIPYTILTQGLYTGILGTISTITIGTCKIISSIYTHKNPNVTKFIQELDIERRLKLIEAVLNTKHINRKHDHDSVTKINYQIDDPVELCLIHVQQIIDVIYANLTDIDKKVAHHNTKWFNTWRSLNIKSKLEQLKINSDILDKRFSDLMEISKFLVQT